MQKIKFGDKIIRGSLLWPADRVRPDWLRGDTRIMVYDHQDREWYGGDRVFFGKDVSNADNAIRLEASDIVYQCIAWNEAHPNSPLMRPWYIRGKCPKNWTYGTVLLSDGTTAEISADSQYWGAGYYGVHVIGYPVKLSTSEYSEPIQTDTSESPATYPALEKIKLTAREAGWVFVPQMTESEADEWLSSIGANSAEALTALEALNIIHPDPTPLDIAKAEFPDADPAMIERIMQIAKGEGK